MPSISWLKCFQRHMLPYCLAVIVKDLEPYCLCTEKSEAEKKLSSCDQIWAMSYEFVSLSLPHLTSFQQLILAVIQNSFFSKLALNCLTMDCEPKLSRSVYWFGGRESCWSLSSFWANRNAAVPSLFFLSGHVAPVSKTSVSLYWMDSLVWWEDHL